MTNLFVFNALQFAFDFFNKYGQMQWKKKIVSIKKMWQAKEINGGHVQKLTKTQG